MRVRVQALVVRQGRILMAKLSQDGQEWWCLPGGGWEAGETQAEGALRELQEECCVQGQVVRQTSQWSGPLGYETVTFLVDIGEQQPRLGTDPEALQAGVPQALVDIAWLSLEEICERDRAFLWAAGLLGVDEYWKVVESWGDGLSYPGKPVTPSAP
jgi:8-oxo-dGTP pyrophosphatase MutT (NUDIX family)